MRVSRRRLTTIGTKGITARRRGCKVIAGAVLIPARAKR